MLLLVSLPILALTGCETDSDQMLSTLDSNVLSVRSDDISRTMDFIYEDRQFEQKDFEQQVSLGLNRWISYSKDDVQDAPVDRSDAVTEWMNQTPELDLVKRMDDFSFLNTDAYFLQQTFWIDQIAARVVANEAINLFEMFRLAADNYKIEPDDTAPLASVLGTLHPELDGDQSVELSKAVKLFDWTIRNIHLLNETQPSEDDIDQQRLNDNEDPVAAGVRATGTQRHPRQTIMFARGDYVDRAKVMLLLCRSAGLQAAMICVDGDEGDLPWAVGVAIGDDYWLFDTKMGLPVPGEKLGAIATLQSVRKTPKLLSSLDLTVEESLSDDTDYWVQADDLKTVQAKIYIEPENASQRMASLETGLVGENRMSVATTPGKVLAELPDSEGVVKSIWDVSLKTHQFRDAVNKAIPQAVSNDELRDRLAWYFEEENYVDLFHIYRTARVRFFKGSFESREEDQTRNAVESAQVLMYTDELIDGLATDKTTRMMVGLEEGIDPLTFESRLQTVQARMRLVRRDMGLFLAQCLFDNGSPGTAANWLEGIASRNDVSRWRPTIMYLLGRSSESRKQYDQAIERYQFEDTPQVHGNLIRARLLKAMLKEQYPEL